MPVLLVLQPTQKAPYYAPLLSALDRIQAERVLKSAWLIEQSTVEMVRKMLHAYLPNSDGYVVAEVSEMEKRPVFRT